MKHVRDDSENTETAVAKTKLHEFVYAVGSGRGICTKGRWVCRMMGRRFYEEEGKTCVTVAGRPRNMTNCMQNENRSYSKTSLKTGLIIRPIRFPIRPIL